ncbi:hypothetical protein [Rossellomorea aquimaris]|uniref:hypothetical protein n=1 Tax=Rossellomorea aquimaris TaxID=189382 RepID=UPI0011E8CE33|nr:hypothetical protein [Rossellomorea aquimaris]TYS91891.1 hypothetical protein FZC88_07090 [Rossellomorea aquimaris]
MNSINVLEKAELNRHEWEVWDKNSENEEDVIFLFGDAEKIEENLLKIIEDNDYDEWSNRWSYYLSVFINRTKTESKAKYYEKMSEIYGAFLQNKYELIPSLLEEASTIRES